MILGLSQGEDSKTSSDNMEGAKESSSTFVNNPDEAQINNIDLGGVLNLAAEDTLNIRFLSSYLYLYLYLY